MIARPNLTICKRSQVKSSTTITTTWRSATVFSIYLSPQLSFVFPKAVTMKTLPGRPCTSIKPGGNRQISRSQIFVGNQQRFAACKSVSQQELFGWCPIRFPMSCFFSNCVFWLKPRVTAEFAWGKFLQDLFVLLTIHGCDDYGSAVRWWSESIPAIAIDISSA